MGASKKTFVLTMAAVFLGNFAAVLSATTIIIPLPYLMQSFATNLATISWTVTAFTLATGIIAPATGYLTNRFGIRHTFIGSMVFFLVTSVMCALAWNVYVLILFRFLQGILCGIIIPVTMTIIYQVVKPQNQAFALSMWSMSGVLAPAMGPTIAGIIIAYVSWQWIFLMNVPIVIIGLLLALRYMPEGEAPADIMPAFDWRGLFFSMTGTTLLLLALSMSQGWGFLHWKTLSLIAAGLALLLFFVRHEFRTPTPLLDLSVFRFRSFSYAGYANSFMTFILNCSIFILPLYLQTVRLYTPIETGLLVLAGPIAVAIVSPIVGKLYMRDIARPLTVTGIGLMGIGFILLSQIHHIASIPYLIFSIIVLESGMGTAKIPATNYGMEVLPRPMTSHGSAIISWIKQCSSALAVGFITTLILMRTRYHLNGVDAANNTEAYRTAYEAGTIDIFHLAIAAALVFALSSFLWMKPNNEHRQTPR